MLKRNIAILIAGALLSAQAGLAVAAEGPFPESADQSQYWKPLPDVEKYLAERAARNPNPRGASGSPFPPRVGTGVVLTPEQLKYFADREAKIRAEGATRTSEGFDTWHMKSQPN
jgi:hypothetical protein